MKIFAPMFFAATLLISFSSVADDVAINPSELECAFAYYFAELPFALAPISSEEEKAALLPNLDWAVARVQKAPKSELAAVHDKVMDKIHAMAGTPGAKSMSPQDLKVLMRQFVSYYDPACHVIADLPPLDFDAFTANLSNFETKFRAGHAQ